MTDTNTYAARLNVDYPETLDRLSTFFRIIWIIPIAIILSLVSSANETVYLDEAGNVVDRVRRFGGGLAIATALMIVFRQRYPRWWFDFAREFTRFLYRVGAYFLLVTDQFPSTVDEQSVHLEIDYPDVERDLNRWLPLIKWLLVLPHYFVLVFLYFVSIFAVIFAWIAIVVTGSYPRVLFDFLVGVGRWGLRVAAYSFLLVTDTYPPFSMR